MYAGMVLSHTQQSEELRFFFLYVGPVGPPSIMRPITLPLSHIVVTFLVERFFLLKSPLNIFMGINGIYIVLKMFKITRARNAGWYEVENQRGPDGPEGRTKN